MMTDELRSLVKDMAKTMVAEPGIGLAPTHVGVKPIFKELLKRKRRQ